MATYTCTRNNMYTCIIIEGSYRVVPIHGYIHVAQCPQAVPLYICNNIIVMEKEAGILWYVLVFRVDMLILLRQWLHRCVQRYAENGRIQKRNVRGRDWESACFSCLTHMDDKNVANGNIREQTNHCYTHTHTHTRILHCCSNGKMCLPLTSLKCQSIPCLPSTFRNLECRKYHIAFYNLRFLNHE